jgi:hypothetical protein
LDFVDLLALREMIAKRLERSSLHDRIIVAGIDISLNLEENQRVGWQLHLYMLVEGEKTRQLEEAIKATFPAEPTAGSPYGFEEVYSWDLLTYVLKSEFYRHSGYTNENGHNSRPQALKPEYLPELMVWLDRFPIHARLIMRGIRRNGRTYQLTKPTTSL